MIPTPINHIAELKKILFSQYQNSPNLIGLLSAFVNIGQDIEDQGNTLFTEYNLETTTPDKNEENYLDAAGSIVGLPRFSLPLDIQFFQFDITPLDQGYRFDDGEGTNYVLIEDSLYQKALRAWSVTINSLGSVNDLIDSLAKLFEVEKSDIEVTETSATEIDIYVDKFLDWNLLQLYNYVTPSGSRLWPKVGCIAYTLTHA